MRRRQEKTTRPVPHVPMHELVREYFNALAMNESPAASADVDGYRDNGLRAGTNLPQEG